MNRVAHFLISIPKALVGFTARLGYANVLDNILFFLFNCYLCVFFSGIGMNPLYIALVAYFITLGLYSLLVAFLKTPGFLISLLKYEKKPNFLKSLWVGFCNLWMVNLLFLINYSMVCAFNENLAKHFGFIVVWLLCIAIYQWCFLTVALVKVMFFEENYIQKVTKTKILDSRKK